MSKSSVIVPVLLIIFCLIGISYLSYTMYTNGHRKAPTCVKLHPYDYILEVDGLIVYQFTTSTTTTTAL